MERTALQKRRERILDDLVRLHASIEDIQGGSCPSDKLREKRIYAILVDMRPSSIPDFNPAFFLPPPRGFHLETPYPRSTQSDDEDDDAASPPNLRYPSLLRRADTQLASTATQRWPSVTGFTPFRNDGAITKGKWPYRDEFTLRHLDTLPHRWKVSEVLECTDHTHPHVILDLATHTDPPDPEHPNPSLHLRVGEIKSIIRVMRISMQREHNSECLLVPILALSYIPPKHGRIIQAHHTGDELIIQYTPVIDFDDPAVSSPGELFLRYYCSKPVLPMGSLDPFGRRARAS